MKFATRTRTPAPTGLQGRATVDRRRRAVLGAARPGDVVVIDQPDLDRQTALALVDAGVAAVVNASAFLSGRYPALGPRLLADAGVLLVEEVGPEVFSSVKDGTQVTLADGVVHVGGSAVASGRVLDAEQVSAAMEAARAGLGSQLESFTHNSAELLRREQDLLLHGHGLPPVTELVRGRPVLVAVAGHDTADELKAVKGWARDLRPVLIGVDRGADLLAATRKTPDVVVVDAASDDADLPSLKVMRKAGEVIVRADPGNGSAAVARLERLGVRPRVIETGLAAEDVALLLACAGEAKLIVGAGMHATLDDFLDRQKGGLTSTWLTRLRVGPQLVDATAVPELYSGRVRPWQLFLALLIGLVAVALAVATTPVGQEWWDEVAPALGHWYDAVNDRVSGILG